MRKHPHLWRLLPALACTLAFGFSTSDQPVRAGEGSTDERLLDGLRARRLFDLAEMYCKQRLERADLSDGQRLDLVLELSRTIAAHAVETPANGRGALWKQAADELDRFQQQHPQHPRLLALGLQKALLELSAGELARQESEVGSVQGAGIAAARTALREAIQQLRQLDKQAAAELQKRSRSPRPEPGQWSVPELVSLQTTIHFQLARAYRNQALCFAPESSDRLNALIQARELLQPLSQLPPESNLAWQSRIDDVVCHRLLRDFSVVERKLSGIAKEEPPAAVRQRLDAEQIRLLLDRRDVRAALAAAGKPGQHTAGEGAELNFARLEAYVAAWRDAAAAKNRANSPAPWEQAATDQVRFIERNHGAYWMRRAETLLATAIAAAPGSESLETLVRAAESYYRGGKPAEAVAAYDRAASQAKTAAAADRAFDLAFTAATIEHQAHHFREAMDRYRALALSAPQHAKADQAHLLAAYDAAQWLQQQAADSQSKGVEEYQQVLEEHLRTFPGAATAGQAAWWLGQLREHDRQWQPAITAYQSVPPSHAQFLPAVEATARCYRGWLAELRAAGQPDEQLAADGAKYFESLIISPSGRLREPWTPATRQAALAAARLWLEDAHDGQAQAEAVLNAALARTDDAPADWLQAARALQVRTLAAESRFKEAAAVVNRLSGSPPEELLSLADLLARSAATAPPASRLSLGQLQLELLALLEPERDKLAAPLRQRLDRSRASALADAGEREQALATIEKLALELPDDGQVHETWAELLTDGDAANRKLALTKWREVQRKSRPGSARWFRANYGLARCLLVSGNKAEARAIIRLVAKAKPDLGGAEMKSRFDKLLAECER